MNDDTRLVRALSPLAKRGYSFEKRSEWMVLVHAPNGSRWYCTVSGILEAGDEATEYVLLAQLVSV